MKMVINYGDELLALILGFVAAHTGYQCMIASAGDSIQHVLHGLDSQTIDLVQFAITTLCGLIGTLGGLWIKYKIQEQKFNRKK